MANGLVSAVRRDPSSVRGERRLLGMEQLELPISCWATRPWRVKFAEVKGPGDSPGDSQFAWLDRLCARGGRHGCR